ncbi:MAG: DinB family protein [Chryseolinea sp.]
MDAHAEAINFADLSNDLRLLVSEHLNYLQEVDEEIFSVKPNPTKWSKKEILGHLIDSAQNNLRRFITAQYEVEPPHIVYNQDFWVSANHYNQTRLQDLILLWKLLNERIAVVLESMSPACMGKLCNTGKDTHVLLPLSFLATDYINHAKHHLRQIHN